MPEDRIFWAYANLLFEALVVFILPLGFAVRELVLLRRDERASVERGEGREGRCSGLARR